MLIFIALIDVFKINIYVLREVNIDVLSASKGLVLII